MGHRASGDWDAIGCGPDGPVGTKRAPILRGGHQFDDQVTWSFEDPGTGILVDVHGEVTSGELNTSNLEAAESVREARGEANASVGDVRFDSKEHRCQLEWNPGCPGLRATGRGIRGGCVTGLTVVATEQLRQSMVEERHRRDEVVCQGECGFVEPVPAQARARQGGVVRPDRPDVVRDRVEARHAARQRAKPPTTRHGGSREVTPDLIGFNV